jgi:hypothetical protein
MAEGKPTTVRSYIDRLPADRREIVDALRETICANLDPLIEEGLQYGMIAYSVPHSVYPAGYHCDDKQPVPFANIANQKGHVGLYLFCTYCDEGEHERFVREWEASGLKLDMGKSCVRIKRIEDVPLRVVGGVIKRATARRFISAYEGALPSGIREKVEKRLAQRAAAGEDVTVRLGAPKKPPAGASSNRPGRKSSTPKEAASKKAAAKKGPSTTATPRSKAGKKRS